MTQTLLEQFQVPVTTALHGSRVHYWPSPTPKPTATLLFIPGNPGLSDYYINYLTSLHRTVNANNAASSLEIFCPSQLGHDPMSPNLSTSLISLDDQIRHKAQILETISTKRWSGDQPRIILSGHSIGAYMSLEIVRRKLNKTPVYSIHLLFPTLYQMIQTPNAKKLSWLLRASDHRQHQLAPVVMLPFWTIIAALLSLVLKAIQLMPLPIVHFIVLLGAPTQPPNAVKTTTNFILSSTCVQQALYMANDEMQLVRKLDDLPQSSISGVNVDVKLRAFWSAGDVDGWAPEKTRRVVESTLRLQNYDLPEEVLSKASTKQPQRRRRYSIEEIRKARLSKRRALAGFVRAGASVSYGLASSLGNLGYRRTETSNVGSSNGRQRLEARPIRRRPSLMAARATRKFDGTIYIEPAEGGDSMDDLLANNGDYAEKEEREEGEVTVMNGKEAKSMLTMPSRASIVSRQGFKHAFVLEHSEQMATISAAMILADMV